MVSAARRLCRMLSCQRESAAAEGAVAALPRGAMLNVESEMEAWLRMTRVTRSDGAFDRGDGVVKVGRRGRGRKARCSLCVGMISIDHWLRVC